MSERRGRIVRKRPFRFPLSGELVSALGRAQGAAVPEQLAARHETPVPALHDVALALAHSNRIVVLEAGRIVLDAPARDLDAAALARLFEDGR